MSKFPILCSQATFGQDCCCCTRCNVGGCDIKVIPCGCCMHARCCPISEKQLLEICSICGHPSSGLHLIPITFDEIDQAAAEASKTSLTNKRGKKRQNATVTRLNPSLHTNSSVACTSGEDGIPGSVTESNDLRTGRWTPEETAFCDKLIYFFEHGYLPIPDKMKLNDFLSNMLKSKQSRLTKKMKNAKLSAKQYKRTAGYIMGEEEAREFSELETALFASIKCSMERSELKFHMQQVWRELFSHFCATIGQKLELDAWLRSVEEMERRASRAMDAFRKARRKAMIGYALSEDTKNQEQGVLIDTNVVVGQSSSQIVIDQNGDIYSEDMASESDSIGGNSAPLKRLRTGLHHISRATKQKSFVARVMHFVQTRQIPFEHVDVWVPSTGTSSASGESLTETNCLSFGGCATADSKTLTGEAKSVPLTGKELYDLVCFGEYSQRFSFKVGSGLPGRVFQSGIPSWEQGIKSAPQPLFERGGGARQWGVQTALGLPVRSPNVGRVVVVLYSIHDRPKDQDLVTRMSEELARLMPVPRWKLVVDVGADLFLTADPLGLTDSREKDLNDLLQSLLSNNFKLAQQIAGIFPLSQILSKTNRSPLEEELLQGALIKFESLKMQGRAETEVAWLTCQEFMENLQSAPQQKQAESAQVGPSTGPYAAGPASSTSAPTNCCPPSSASICCPSPSTTNCSPPDSRGCQLQQLSCCPAPCPPFRGAYQQQQQEQQFPRLTPVDTTAPNESAPDVSVAEVMPERFEMPSRSPSTGSSDSSHATMVPEASVLATELDDVSFVHVDDRTGLAENDLGMSAMQLAQLFQSEAAGFSF